MNFPYLQPLKTTKEKVETFGGYNHRDRIGAGEWFDMENLSSRKFPLVSPRLPRGRLALTAFHEGGRILGKTHLWVVQDQNLVGVDPISGSVIYTFSGVFEKPPLLTSFSSYIVDMNNGRWFEIEPGFRDEYKTGLFSYASQGKGNAYGVYICDEKGQPVEENHFGATPPEECVGGMLWFDTTTAPGVLKRYYEDSASFVEEPYYLRVSMDGDLTRVLKGDMVYITLPCPVDSQGTAYGMVDGEAPKKVLDVGVNTNGTLYLVVEGQLNLTMGYSYNQGEITFYGGTNPPENLTMKGNICRVENPIPRMDFVVEAGNRLWGCRYGTNRKGETVNEIYASALGSFRVWEKFEGISDDSFMLSCGTDGPFTGAVTYNGQPIFFKEDCMHRVYGTFPFGVTPVACNGVQAGSADSLALVGNQLFYKSPAGICTYSGSQPILLDLPFGGISYHSAMGAGNQTHYYLAMKDSQGIPVLFVYDTVTGLMMKEKGEAFLHLAGFGGQVYATLVTPGGKQLLCLTGQPGLVPTDETKVHWFGISGIIGMRQPGGRYVQNLELVLSLPMGTAFRVWAQYDSDGEWVPLADLTGGKTRHITLPLRVRRCDHLQLKIQGKGEFTLHALIKTLREGGHGRCT